MRHIREATPTVTMEPQHLYRNFPSTLLCRGILHHVQCGLNPLTPP